MTYTAEGTSFDKTFSVKAGDTFAINAQSTCGAGGSASVKIYKDSTLVASDSKVGPNIAQVGVTF